MLMDSEGWDVNGQYREYGSLMGKSQRVGAVRKTILKRADVNPDKADTGQGRTAHSWLVGAGMMW